MFGLRTSCASVASAILASALLASTVLADDAPPVAPAELFLRARDRIAAQHLPPYLAYRERLDLNVSGDFRRFDLRVALRVRDGATSVEDATHQAVAESFSLSPVAYARVVSAELPPASASLFTGDADDAPTTLTIGRVQYRSSRYYTVGDAGTESIDEAPMRHLRFVPRMDPALHPLRDAWIDPSDDRLVRARVAGHVVLPGAIAPCDLIATFREIAGVTMIVHVTGDGHAEGLAGTLAFTIDQRFDDIRPGATPEASWRFPQAARP